MDLVADCKELLALAGQLSDPVGSDALPGNADIAALSLSKNLDGDIGTADWSFRAGARVGIRVINSASDVDPGHVIGTSDADASDDDAPETGPRPVIAFEPGKAWLRYAFDGNAKGTASAVSGHAAVVVSGQGHVGAGSYLPADPSTSLEQAIRAQLASLPLVFDAGDVASLPQDAAVFTLAGGQLSASLTLSWADLFTGPIAELRAFALSDAPLVFDADASARVEFEVEFSDSYRVVFAGLGNDRVRLCVNRASSDAFSISSSATVSVGLKDPAQIDAIVAPMFAQLIGPQGVGTELQDQIAKLMSIYQQTMADIDNAVGDVADRLDGALDRLGADTALTRLAQLQKLITEVGAAAPALADRLRDASLDVQQTQAIIERVQALPGKVADEIDDRLDAVLKALKIEPMLKDAQTATTALLDRIASLQQTISSAATRRVELGVSYEYRRTASNATVFSADLDTTHARFADYHAAALALDVETLLTAAGQADSGVTLQSFLNRRSTSFNWSLGLSLGGLGSVWSGGSSWVDVDRELPSPRGPATQHSAALKGYRGYTGAFGGDKAEYRGDFSAEFASENKQPGTWRYALSLQYQRQTDRADAGWIGEIADQAELWRIVHPGHGPALAQRLQTEYGCLDQPVQANCTLTLGAAAFAADLTERLASISDADVRDALGAALPYSADYVIRRSVSLRATTYQSVGNALLALALGAPVDMRLIATLAANDTRDSDHTLSQREAAATTPSNALPWTAASVAYVDGNYGAVRKGVNGIIDAAQRLQRAAASGSDDTGQRRLLQQSLDAWQSLWADGYSLRWCGALLLALAFRSTASYNATTCVMRLNVGDGENARAIVVAPPA